MPRASDLIKHGRDSDTATLARIAAALQIDLAELFMTRQQIEIVRAVQREVGRLAKAERAHPANAPPRGKLDRAHADHRH